MPQRWMSFAVAKVIWPLGSAGASASWPVGGRGARAPSFAPQAVPGAYEIAAVAVTGAGADWPVPGPIVATTDAAAAASNAIGTPISTLRRNLGQAGGGTRRSPVSVGGADSADAVIGAAVAGCASGVAASVSSRRG